MRAGAGARAGRGWSWEDRTQHAMCAQQPLLHSVILQPACLDPAEGLAAGACGQTNKLRSSAATR